MEVHKDFKELLALFNGHSVDYLIVGGYALAFHGAPRYTGDIDLFVKPDPDNAANVMRALDEFGFGNLDLSTADFSAENKVVQLGFPPVRIDIITSISGVAWSTARSHRVHGTYGDTPVWFIGKDDFVANKQSIGRHKDFADVEALGVNPQAPGQTDRISPVHDPRGPASSPQ